MKEVPHYTQVPVYTGYEENIWQSNYPYNTVKMLSRW